MTSQTEAVSNTTFDNQEAEAFLNRTSDIINAGAQAVMISIGHRSGLFDVMATLSPQSSQHIADVATLNERYVREWLAVVVTAGIVLYDADHKTYHLPAAHAACLTRNAALGNMALFAQYIPLLGAVQDHTLRCLESGGGTDYGDYPCFHQIMAEDSEQSVVNSLSSAIVPLMPGMDEKLHAGIDVMDAGCGSGRALIAMAERYPRSQFTGYDLCEEAVTEATRKAHVQSLKNVSFVVKDLSNLKEQSQYDLITSFDAIHDQRDPQDLIKRIHCALKPAGVYLMQDIGGSAHLENNLDFPMASLLYAISCAHCTPISIGQGGEGLGTMWGWETAQAMLNHAGFISVECHTLPHDPTNVWFVSSKA